MSRRFLLPLAFALPLAGCELFGIFDQPLELPLDLTTPAQDFDVTAGVDAVEDGACSEAGSASCLTLTAICQSEEGRDCATPTMPDTFPSELEVVPGEPPVQARAMMDELGVSEATEMEIALPVDVAAALAEEGVQTPDAVQNVSIGALVMEWPENTLTFDAPPLDLYIAKDAVEPGALDAEALIASGAAAAAALRCAAGQPTALRATVLWGARPDMVGRDLAAVTAPSLLLVGADSPTLRELNRSALACLSDPAEFALISCEPGAAIPHICAWLQRTVAASAPITIRDVL